MKKFLVVCAAATLCCSLVRAQEAEDTGRGAGLSIIPRLDVGTLYNIETESFGVSFGNTSLYTLFEGNFSEKWGFSLCNHWAQADGWAANLPEAFGPATADLYHLNVPFLQNNANNFIDWAYVTFSPGPFTFTLGKQPQLMGGFEFDDYDFDVNPFLASAFWNSYTCYQWGLTASWTMLSETSTLSLQVSTNAWNDGVSFAIGWDGTYGPYSMKWSVLETTVYETPEFLVSLGNRLEFGSFTFSADYFNRCGDPLYLESYKNKVYEPAGFGHTVVASATYDFDGKWDIGVKGVWNGYDKTAPYGRSAANSLPRLPYRYDAEAGEPLQVDEAEFADICQTFSAGLWGSWYPLRDSQALRVQLAAGLAEINPSQHYSCPFATLGVTWNWEIKLW